MRGGGKEDVKETNDIKSHRRDGATPYKYTSFFFPKVNKTFDATSRALVLDSTSVAMDQNLFARSTKNFNILYCSKVLNMQTPKHAAPRSQP